MIYGFEAKHLLIYFAVMKKCSGEYSYSDMDQVQNYMIKIIFVSDDDNNISIYLVLLLGS